MKVCDLALFAPASSSGVKTYISSKIDYVSRRPHIEHLVIVPGAADSVAIEGRSTVVTVRGVPSFYPGVRVALNVVGVAQIIEREQPDIIEVNCQYTLPWAAFLATRRRPTPIVGVYHTDVPACARHWARAAGTRIASAVERLVELYEGLIYRHFTLTILLNTTMEERVARLGVRRTRCLPCGVDVDMFHPGRRSADFRRRLGVLPDRQIVFYAGRFSPEKELCVLLAAFERLPADRFVLMLAGDGPDASAVARYANAHPFVRHLGHLDSREDLAIAYASSDVFVTPGRYETFGMASLEAMSSGLPVVGAQDSGTAMLVTGDTGVLTPAGDAASMANAIVTLTQREPHAQRLACRAFAAAHFSWDHVFDRYFDTYRELIDATPVGMAVPA